MRDEHISHEEPQDGLHISHINAPHHTRDGDERDARERRPNHPNRYDIPGRLPVPKKEGLVARISTSCEPSYAHEDAEIEHDDEEDDITVHCLF